MPASPSAAALPPLPELVERLRASPAWQRKRELTLLSRGELRLEADVGDDAIALPDGDGYLLLAAEVMWPPMVAAEPELAGRNAVLVNANDIYAMGGRPIALLDTLLAASPPSPPSSPDARAASFRAAPRCRATPSCC